jgi:hypothetical protein
VAINSTAQREVVVPRAEDVNYLHVGPTSRKSEPEICSLCYGTGMEVVAGKGARRCYFRTLDMGSEIQATSRSKPPNKFTAGRQ